jgi:hypothetical protein
LGNDRNPKSRFVDSSGVNAGSIAITSQAMNGVRSGNQNGIVNPLLNDSNLDYQYSSSNPNGVNIGMTDSDSNQKSEQQNQIFDKIINEVIHVSAYDTRSNVVGMYNQSNEQMVNMVQEMPFKMKGLLEPINKQQQFTLPDGVPAPLSVLAAQPPFLDDIRLISNIAYEANNCINNFSLAVPDNVAFDFKPVKL